MREALLHRGCALGWGCSSHTPPVADTRGFKKTYREGSDGSQLQLRTGCVYMRLSYQRGGQLCCRDEGGGGAAWTEGGRSFVPQYSTSASSSDKRRAQCRGQGSVGAAPPPLLSEVSQPVRLRRVRTLRCCRPASDIELHPARWSSVSVVRPATARSPSSKTHPVRSRWVRDGIPATARNLT